VSLVATSPYLMLVPKDFPARTVKEFIDYAKARPGQLALASSGSGGMPHLTGEMFQLMTGTKLNHVPYKGTGAVFIDLIAGRVQVTFSDIAAAYPHVASGNLRVLGITSPQRSKAYPDIPTVAEAGVPGFDSVGWFGVFSPGGTPAVINRRLSQAIATYVKQPAVQDQLNKLGVEPTASTPEAFRTVLRRDLDRWAKVVKDSGAKVD
jgi:tripartite-type tricarboxylate transporter receptor subunit TctC